MSTDIACQECDRPRVPGFKLCETHAKYRMGQPTLEELESRVREAQRALDAERQRLQSLCGHRMEDLTFAYSGVSSYRPGHVDHGLTISCKCGRQFSKHLSIVD